MTAATEGTRQPAAADPTSTAATPPALRLRAPLTHLPRPQAWDLKSGALLRTQAVHRGMVTSVVYASGARLLFSASIDGAIGVWGVKGTLLQVGPESS